MLGRRSLKNTMALVFSLVIISSVLECGGQVFAQQPPQWQANQMPWGNHTYAGALKPCFPLGGHGHRGHFVRHGNQTSFGMHPYGMNGTWIRNGTHNFGQFGNHAGFRLPPCPANAQNSTAGLPAGGNQSASMGPTSGKIPSWVRNNAKWWSEGQMGDSDFVQGVQFLIQQGIMKIPPTQANQTSGGQPIPAWVKTNAKWWSQGQISDDDFIKGIQYLVSNGIVKI